MIQFARENGRFAFFLLLATLARLAFVSDTLSITSTDLVSSRIATHLAVGSYFGQGSVPDLSAMPLYPALLALLIKLFSLDLALKLIWLLNCLFDLLSLVILVRLAKRFFPSSAAVGLLILSVSPLWIGYVTVASPHCLVLTLALFFLERWTKPERTRRNEVEAGLALAAASLAEAWLFPFALAPFFLASGERRKRTKKRTMPPLPWAFLASATLPPLAWLLRNWLLFGRVAFVEGIPFSFSPSRVLEFWYLGWLRPFHSIYLPEYLGPVYFWIFGGIVEIFGLAGLLRGLRKREPLALALGSLALFETLASLFLAIDAHYSLLIYVPLSLWAGPELLRACQAGAVTRGARA